MPAPQQVRKPIPASLKAENWYVRVVYAGTGREWTFSCDGTVADELRRAMLEGRMAHLQYAGTEAILNPQHVATVELQRQTDGVN